ncbi:hypothetical protein ACLOJK_040699 [Asimina triloba]
MHEIPEASKFREKGLPFHDDMDILFKDVVATGDRAWAPSSGVFPYDTAGDEGKSDEDNEGLDHNYVSENITITNSPNVIKVDASNSIREKRKRNKQIGETENFKRSNATRITRCMEQLVEAMQSRASQSMKTKEEKASVESVIEIVRELPEMEEGRKYYVVDADIIFKNGEDDEELLQEEDGEDETSNGSILQGKANELSPEMEALRDDIRNKLSKLIDFITV